MFAPIVLGISVREVRVRIDAAYALLAYALNGSIDPDLAAWAASRLAWRTCIWIEAAAA